MGSLHVARVVAPQGPAPTAWMVFLHGILGSGSNWRSFARQLVEARPSWGALLVDLRLHGDSRGFLPPHTLTTAAEDVASWLSQQRDGPVRAVLGHSFGGKVGIELARQLGHSAQGAIDHLFVIDSTPGPRPDRRGSSSVVEIVDLLEGVPRSFPDRSAFTAWVEARGVSRPTAMWLAMNVRPVPNTTIFELRLDIAQIRAMLADYFLCDLWPVLEHPPVREARVMETHLIAGGLSDVLDASDRARGRSLPHTTLDVLAKAGHWVHVDAPKELLETVLRHLDAMS